MDKKFEFTGDTKEVETVDSRWVTVGQIRALKDIPKFSVKKGELGGWIEHDESELRDGNLSHQGSCWLSANSFVIDHARVEGNALVQFESQISEQAVIKGDAVIEGSIVQSTTLVRDTALIRDSKIDGESQVAGDVYMSDSNLLNVNVTSGRIERSRITAKETVILFWEKATILNCHLRVYGTTASIRSTCHLSNVKALDIKNLVINQETTMENVLFEGQVFLSISGRGSSGTFIKGTQLQPCLFKNINSSIVNSHIEGAIVVKGAVTLEDSQLMGNASVLNETNNTLSLINVQLSELACILKNKGESSKRVYNTEMGADSLLTI